MRVQEGFVALLLLVTVSSGAQAEQHEVNEFSTSTLGDVLSTFDDGFDQPQAEWTETTESMAPKHSVALVKDIPGGKLAPDERGLALLRSPALADKPLRIIGVVGQARTGKSFFMNSLVGKSRTFEVSSGDEGFTKGLWLHHLDDSLLHPNGAKPSPPAVEQLNIQSRDESADGAPDMATILIDSEGLGAPGGSKVYDTKMVALTYMLSSVTFYNNMRKVNKMDVEFLGDVVLFDDIFRSISQQPLLASSIVWLVQVRFLPAFDHALPSLNIAHPDSHAVRLLQSKC